jgi:hypothetical protein
MNKNPCWLLLLLLLLLLLQIVLRLSNHFQAKEFMSCIKRLPAADLTTGGSDGSVLGEQLGLQ